MLSAVLEQTMEEAIDAIDWRTIRTDPSRVDDGVSPIVLVETEEFIAIGVLEKPVIETLHRVSETPDVEHKVGIRTQHMLVLRYTLAEVDCHGTNRIDGLTREWYPSRLSNAFDDLWGHRHPQVVDRDQISLWKK